MQPADPALDVLLGIREEVHRTNARLGDANTRLDGANTRLDETNARLARIERRQAETEVRLSTELVAVVGAVREVRDLLRDDRGLSERIADHEHRLAALEQRER
jgi:predicted  nucleic acid-binding Zn-ribbon protein